MRLQPREHLVHLDGLDDVVDPAAVEGRDDVFGLGEARHENDRQVRECRVGLDPAARIEAAQPGHDRIEQHGVGEHHVQALERGFAVQCDDHAVAGGFKTLQQRADAAGMVVDQQDDGP